MEVRRLNEYCSPVNATLSEAVERKVVSADPVLVRRKLKFYRKKRLNAL